MPSHRLNFLAPYPRQFKLMFWGMLLSTSGSSMIWPFLLIYVKGRTNLPLAAVASLFTVNAIAGLVSGLIGGAITDRIGRKWVMVISLAGNAVVYLLLSQAETLPMFAVLMALMGTFNPLYRVGGDAMLADLIPPEQRPDAYALLRLSNNLGISLGPTIGGFITLISYEYAFYGAAVGMFSYSLMLAYLAKETLSIQQKESTAQQPSLGGYAPVIHDTPFLSFAGVFILTQMCSVMIWTLMPVYANTHYGVPESQYGLIPTTNALMVVLLQILVTRITRRFAALPTLAAGTLFYAVAVGGVSLGRNFLGFWIVMVVMTIGELILMPTASTYVANQAPAHMRGRYMSIFGLTWGISAGIGPVLGGFLSDTISPAATWYAGFLVGMLAVFSYIILSIQKRKARQPA